MDLTKMGMIQLQNPCHPTGLLHKANQMRLAGTLCDVVIMVDSQEFHAHRTVLACTSKMFEILFHRNSQHYTLDFLSPKTFQQILEYAYTATLQAKVEDLDDLLYAAEILEIEYLEEQCLKILETIQASEDNDAEVAMADGGAAAEDEEERKSRYIKGLFVSKPTGEESSYAGVAGQSLPAATAEQSPSASASFGPLSAMSPTKAAVDSLMTIGQSLLQGAPPPGAPEDSRPTATRRPPGLAEVKTEAMQVDDTSSRDSPRAAEPGASGGEKPDEKGKEGPGTPTRSSVITSARELHYAREEGAEPPPEPGQGLPPAPEPSAAAQGEKPLGIYSLLPNHKTEPVLGVPPSVASALHVQPALAVSMDFSAYGGLLPQGFIQRELFSKLGELAAGMKTESRALGEQCSVCGAELPDNETLEQHRYGHGRFLPAVREAVPDAERPAAAHGGARRGAQLHLQRVQPYFPQPHRAQEAPPLPHRRPPLRVRVLRQLLPGREHAEGPQAHPHRREALRVQRLRQEVQPQAPAGDPLPGPHRREALRVQAVPPALPGLLGHDQTPADPQRRFPLPVHHLPGVLPQPLRHAEAHEGPQAGGDPHRLADREDLSLPLLRLREEAQGQRGRMAEDWAERGRKKKKNPPPNPQRPRPCLFSVLARRFSPRGSRGSRRGGGMHRPPPRPRPLTRPLLLRPRCGAALAPCSPPGTWHRREDGGGATRFLHPNFRCPPSPRWTPPQMP
ncbi:zinc finger and BTB domain-containing protein 16 isoform X3 [Grus americana]|uniref:zinc finger and BTB domain-containing protein 16 isoform X3 n=1 Tax=Grus americana TaxID=9117 RepID=UPI002407AE71|nr:zinc finger and BTB domain-containing protein 16 isoform X3 [Grus americana]